MDTIIADFENWGSYLLKQFHLMYLKGERCDLEISCNKHIFLVHRILLSSCSEYVKHLGYQQHIILPDEVSFKSVGTIIDFAYTGKIVFHENEKHDLLLVATLLDMQLLIELINVKESCSFTLSVDDDFDDDSRDTKIKNNCTNNDITAFTDSIIRDQPSALPPTYSLSKAEYKEKSNYSEINKNSATTQTASRSVSDRSPSRLCFPFSMLENCDYLPTFGDVTYETEIICDYERISAPLEPVHLEFLEEVRDFPLRENSLFNTLYSVFDEHCPCPTSNTEVHAFSNEGSAEFSSNCDCTMSVTHLTMRNFTPEKNVPTSNQKLEQLVNSDKAESIPAVIELPMVPPKINYPFGETNEISAIESLTSIDIRSTRIETAELKNDSNIDDDIRSKCLPPVVLNTICDVSKERNNNVVSFAADELKDAAASTQLNIVNGSLTNAAERIKDTLEPSEQYQSELSSVHAQSSYLKFWDLKRQLPHPCEDVTVIDVPDIGQLQQQHPNILSSMEVRSDIVSVSANNSLPAIYTDYNNFETEAVLDAREESFDDDVTISKAKNVASSIDAILSDSTVFTPIDKRNIGRSSTESNSQIFALKVKGAENASSQLTRLVSLCKMNPLFVNKNVKFKIVPIKENVSDDLSKKHSLFDGYFNVPQNESERIIGKRKNANEMISMLANDDHRPKKPYILKR